MDEKTILAKLQRLCSRAEYCTSDIRRKAVKALSGVPGPLEEMADRIVASLVEERYVDDARYAAAFAREKSSLQGWGPVKIRYQLRSKGISEDVIKAALGEIENDRAVEKLERLVAAKARTLDGDPQRRLKLIRFALSRGYEYSDIEAVIDKF